MNNVDTLNYQRTRSATIDLTVMAGSVSSTNTLNFAQILPTTGVSYTTGACYPNVTGLPVLEGDYFLDVSFGMSATPSGVQETTYGVYLTDVPSTSGNPCQAPQINNHDATGLSAKLWWPSVQINKVVPLYLNRVYWSNSGGSYQQLSRRERFSIDSLELMTLTSFASFSYSIGFAVCIFVNHYQANTASSQLASFQLTRAQTPMMSSYVPVFTQDLQSWETSTFNLGGVGMGSQIEYSAIPVKGAYSSDTYLNVASTAPTFGSYRSLNVNLYGEGGTLVNNAVGLPVNIMGTGGTISASGNVNVDVHAVGNNPITTDSLPVDLNRITQSLIVAGTIGGHPTLPVNSNLNAIGGHPFATVNVPVNLQSLAGNIIQPDLDPLSGLSRLPVDIVAINAQDIYGNQQTIPVNITGVVNVNITNNLTINAPSVPQSVKFAGFDLPGNLALALGNIVGGKPDEYAYLTNILNYELIDKNCTGVNCEPA